MVCRRFLLISLFLFIVSCVPNVEPHPPVHLRLAGSTSMVPLMEELAQAYRARYDYVTFSIEERGSQLGIEALRYGGADIALVSREMSGEEKGEFAFALLARDGIAVVINEENPVSHLTLEQLRAIFAGEVLTWEEVGGGRGDIQVVSREEGSGTRGAFENLVMEGEEVTSAAVVMPTNEAVVQYVAQEPLAIGYASLAALAPGTKALALGGVSPDLQMVSKGEYPLIRPFLLITKKNPADEVRAFVDFCLHPVGQALVSKNYARAK